jgi:iron uptake system EfeUOB component EfeO/EfeM
MRSPGSIGRLRALALAAATALALASVAAATTSRHTVAPTTIKVTFTDNSLRATPTAPAAGKTTFVVVNKGKKVHLLMVKGPGVKSVRTAKLAAGHSAKLTVTLKPGAYALSDPVGLGPYGVFFLDVVPSTTLSAKGGDNSVQPEPVLPPMCGITYTP